LRSRGEKTITITSGLNGAKFVDFPAPVAVRSVVKENLVVLFDEVNAIGFGGKLR
jgi:hypothetical protein